MANKFLNPKTHATPPGYTHVVNVTAPTRLVFVAGQLGQDKDGNFVGGPGNFRAQAEQVYQNLKDALAAVGAGFEHVVKTTNYILDINHLPELRAARAKFITGSNPPASTLVVIKSLARPDALVEIEAIAAVPERAISSTAVKPARKKAAAKKSKSRAKK